MSKVKLGIIVGTVLGLLDGLSTFLIPEAVESGMMPMIITGSTIKGLITGWLIGFFSERHESMFKGLAFGLAVGPLLSFIVELAPDPNGEHHYFEIMLPGALLGLVVGFVCQRWGRSKKAVLTVSLLLEKTKLGTRRRRGREWAMDQRLKLVAAALVWTCAVGIASQDTVERANRVLDQVLSPLTDDGGPGCVCAILAEGEAVAVRTMGLASVEFRASMQRDTPFYVGSVAKQFLAAMALMLEKNGQLDLGAPIIELAPELNERFREVKVNHLLHHTSGLRDYLQGAHHAGVGSHRVFEDDDVLAFLGRQSRLGFRPGTDTGYSNSNFFLLRILIERTTGESINSVADRLVFDPIGMENSRFMVDGLEVVEGRARGYRKARDGSLRLHEPASGPGGLLTTLDDLILWAKWLREWRLNERPLIDELTAPTVLADGRTTNEAAGLRVGTRYDREVIEHNGSNRGFTAQLEWYPEEDLLFIALCNVRQLSATSICHQLAAKMFAAKSSPGPKYPTLDAAALSCLTPFAGVYTPTEGPLPVLELEVDAPHAILTLYGAHPSDSRTASNVLQVMPDTDVFQLFGLPDGFALELRPDSKGSHLIIRSPDTPAVSFHRQAPASREQIQAAVGRFHSPDLNATYRLEMVGGELELTIERPGQSVLDRGALKPVTGDFFVLQRDVVTNFYFHRDDTGRVTGLQLNEPRLRNVQFHRTGDGH